MTNTTQSSEELARALERFVPKERVHIDDLTLTVYSRAADFFEYRPQAVVKARTEEEVHGVLRVANEYKVPITFRSAGTSLSGQALGTGIICDVSTGFRGIEPRDDAKLVWAQPGPTGEMVDGVLAPLGRRIGPDPASQRAARIGGMISNNSSGMTCGVKFNTYHTLHSMRVMLVDDPSLIAMQDVPHLPDFVYTRPAGSCALLIDFWRETNEEVDKVVAAVEPKIRKVEGLIDMSPFTRRPDEHRTLWESRSNLLGLVHRFVYHHGR